MPPPIRTWPVRQKSAQGQPPSRSSFTRACAVCGACFIQLAPGKTGEAGIWRENWEWFCSVECDAHKETP